MANLLDALAYTLPFEGGYSDTPGDKGGETYHGITQATLYKYIHDHPGTQVHDSVKDLTIPDVQEVYSTYWRYDGIKSQQVASKLFDMGVNIGPFNAVKMAQKIVSSFPDGFFGPITEIAINAYPKEKLLAGLCSAIESYYNAIIIRDPTQAKFKNGWLKRARSVPGEDE